MRKSAALICLLAGFGASTFAANESTSPGAAELTAKMDRIIFPHVRFEEVTLDEAVEYLRVKSRDLDSQETRRKHKGVNVWVRNADGKRTAPLISLDLKDVSLKAALNRISELAGCTCRFEDQEVVVESLAFQGRKETRKPPAKTTAQVPARIRLSVQVAELPEARDTVLPQREDVDGMKPKPGSSELELYSVLSEPQRRTILQGLAQRKHLTLHEPDSRIVGDESTTTFSFKDELPSMKVTVESDPGHPALDCWMEFPAPADNRTVSMDASLWSGQTVVLSRHISDEAGHSRSVFVFVSATVLDAEGKSWVKSAKP